MSLRHLALTGAIAIFCANALAGSLATDGQDKSRYNLLDPTPANLLRELASDRPDKTESPITVDAGHYQLEMDFATFALDRANGVRTEIWNVAPLNLRVGLLNNLELSLVFDSYLHAKEEAGTTSTMSGVGDFTTRAKINLWGNDGGQTAFAILPFVKFPTNTDGLGNNSVEGGVIFPLSVKLPWKIDMGGGTGIGFGRNESGSNYHAQFLNSVTFGHEIIGKLGGYCEFFANVRTERDSDWIGTVDLGLTYALTENLQLDCGCNIGATHAADDFNAFSGISVRF